MALNLALARRGDDGAVVAGEDERCQGKEEDCLALPLILAGQIVWRVEPRLVSVWVVLSEARQVKLSVWPDRIKDGSGSVLFHPVADPILTSDEVSTPRTGEHLHIAVVSATSPGPETRPASDGEPAETLPSFRRWHLVAPTRTA